MFTQPVPQPQRQGRKTAVELAPIPQTAGELWGYSEAWSDEMSYLAGTNPAKYANEYAYAEYQAALFSWLAIQLRNDLQYTSEHHFSTELIEQLKDLFDRSFPDKVKSVHIRQSPIIEKLEKQLSEVDLKAPNAVKKLKDAISNAIDDLAENGTTTQFHSGNEG
jgi:hypothetical protein